MNAQDIIAQIINWNKDATYSDVADLLDGKASISDFEKIKCSLYDHMSSNEMNAARYAVMHLT